MDNKIEKNIKNKEEEENNSLYNFAHILDGCAIGENIDDVRDERIIERYFKNDEK